MHEQLMLVSRDGGRPHRSRREKRGPPGKPHLKSAVTKIAEDDAAGLLRVLGQILLVNAVGQGDGGGLVEQAQAVEAADARGN